jgi:hypothetical protein
MLFEVAESHLDFGLELSDLFSAHARRAIKIDLLLYFGCLRGGAAEDQEDTSRVGRTYTN